MVLGALAALLAAAVGLAWPVWSALDLVSPEPGAVVGVEGAVVLAHFRPGASVEAGSVRVWLNGADVTSLVEAGSNGAYGRLHGLLAGENHVRVEAFAAPLWPGSLRLRTTREVRFRFRPPVGFDRG